jgi:hypothetical protein
MAVTELYQPFQDHLYLTLAEEEAVHFHQGQHRQLKARVARAAQVAAVMDLA